MASTGRRPRVVVLGLDAAEWTVVERLLNAGDLPNLARLRDSGTTCRLRQSTPLTEQPWVAFLCGEEAPETALRFKPDSYETYEVGAPLNPPFYAQPGLRALVLDVPRMTLAYPVEGIQITGWGGHHLGYPPASRPSGILTRLNSAIGPHQAFSEFNELRWYDTRELETLTNRMIAGALRRVDVLRRLVERVPDWDLIVTVSPEAHTLGQILWHGFDEEHPLADILDGNRARRQLCDVYKGLDQAIGRLLHELPRDVTVLVCSVHGIKRNDHDVTSALLPELLARLFAGEGRFWVPDPSTWRSRDFAPVQPGRSSYAARYGGAASLPRRVSGWIGHHARQHAPSAMAAARRLTGRRHAPEPETTGALEAIGESRLPADQHVAWRYRDLWPRMKAFALPTYTIGRVRINLRGRERNGVVPPDMYDAACDEVESIVRACRNPRTGRAVVDEVVRRSPAERSDSSLRYDDLSIIWTDCSDALEHPATGVIGPLAFGRTGAHSTQGFALVAGPGIPHADLGERPAIDLTPTILALVGRDPGAHMTGRPFLPRQ